MFELEEVMGESAKIRVVGVGGAGGNAINNMIASDIHGVDFIAVNTDAQALETSLAPITVQIGKTITRGLGSGSDPELGRQSALEDREAIKNCLEGSDMVFITAGMGGGTGTGASPVIANIAKELGILTVAVVTKPFFYEGKIRANNAEEGTKELKKHVDTIIVIPNDRISLIVEKGTPLLKSFSTANDVLKQAVHGISDIILTTGLINVDFADVRTIMSNTGRAVMGVGSGKGEGRALEAAKKAICNPLLENSSIDGAKGILINITGGLGLTLEDVNEAMSLIYDSSHADAHIISGAVVNPDIEDEVRVIVIATGFGEKKEKVEMPQVKKWIPSQNLVLKGSDRVLTKSLLKDAVPVPTEVMSYENTIDIPTFLRDSLSKKYDSPRVT